jgi:hypothetical protein
MRSNRGNARWVWSPRSPDPMLISSPEGRVSLWVICWVQYRDLCRVVHGEPGEKTIHIIQSRHGQVARFAGVDLDIKEPQGRVGRVNHTRRATRCRNHTLSASGWDMVDALSWVPHHQLEASNSNGSIAKASGTQSAKNVNIVQQFCSWRRTVGRECLPYIVPIEIWSRRWVSTREGEQRRVPCPTNPRHEYAALARGWKLKDHRIGIRGDFVSTVQCRAS